MDAFQGSVFRSLEPAPLLCQGFLVCPWAHHSASLLLGYSPAGWEFQGLLLGIHMLQLSSAEGAMLVTELSTVEALNKWQSLIIV